MLTNTALIAAGGLGTRAADITYYSSKSFITYKDKPLIYYTILSVKLAGIDQIIVSIDDKRYKSKLQNIKDKLNIKLSHKLVTRIGATGIPFHCRDMLPERFFYLYGNSPPSPQHLVALDDLTNREELGVSLFDNTTSAKPRKIKMNGNQIVELNFEGCSKNTGIDFYLNLPLILTKRYVELLPKQNFDLENTLKTFMTDGIIRGKVANFPPEFNYSYELPKTFSIVDDILNIARSNGYKI